MALGAGCGRGAGRTGAPDAPDLTDAMAMADAPTIDAPPRAPCTPARGTQLRARRLAEPIGGSAVLATAPPGDDRLFVVDQRGAIRIYRDERLVAAPFLDLSAAAGGPVLAGGEQGLLGLAFHPDYARNGQLFVYYTARKFGDPRYLYADVVARYTVSAADPDRATPRGAVILAIDDPASTHNGGMIEFGPDGYLYIGTGDGGGQGDPQRTGQDPGALLGKLLRIDVDRPSGGKPYGIPADNPFASGGGAPEVFALGLRNPWRWSFDRATGDLWIADVGQGAVEEINRLPASAQRGANLGWSMYEGTRCCMTEPDRCFSSAPIPCDPAGQTFPVIEHSHASGWFAIVGGSVYRGACSPDLVGWYVYTDYVRGGLSVARPDGAGGFSSADLPGSFPASPTSLHADGRGELYETDALGQVYRLEAEEAPPPGVGAAR